MALKRLKITLMIVEYVGDDVEMVLGEVFSLLTGDIPSTLSEDSNY